MPRFGGTGGRGGHIYVLCKEGATLENVSKSEGKRFFAGHGAASSYAFIYSTSWGNFYECKKGMVWFGV